MSNVATNEKENNYLSKDSGTTVILYFSKISGKGKRNKNHGTQAVNL